jgi:deoxyribonuclease IV
MAPMLPDGRRLGAHLALGDAMVKAADRAIAIGADALQVFTDNPIAWQRRAEPSPEIDEFRSVLAAHDVAPLAVHASYLINLAGSDETLRARSLELLASELATADRFGARFVNVHTGSHGGSGREVGIERLAEGIAQTLGTETATSTATMSDPGHGPVITLENSSGGGAGLGVDLDEWVAIARAIARAGIDRARVAFCIDTAHLWGAGIDASAPAAIDDLLSAFDGEIGLDRLPLIHLNDTKAELGSRMDRHEHLGAGRIGAIGLAHVLRHPRLAGVAYILETPGMDEGYDAINLDRALALARGEPLTPLPPGALSLRGSRMRHATPPAEPLPIAAAAATAAATAATRRP